MKLYNAVLTALASGLVAGIALGRHLERTQSQEDEEMPGFSALRTELQGITNARLAMVTLMQRLTARIDELSASEAEITTLAGELRAETDAIIAATLAGTPADPAVTPGVPPIEVDPSANPGTTPGGEIGIGGTA